MKALQSASGESTGSRMFYWVVRHLRALARVPTLAQLFDGLLVGWTGFSQPERLTAMAFLERRISQMPDISLRVHRLGGTEFHHAGLGELGHVHGHGLVDVWLGRDFAASLLSEGRVGRHHVLPQAGWVSFQLERCSDVRYAIRLLEMARQYRASKGSPWVPSTPGSAING